ncbi:hypothetical protein ALP73_02936 [Pseudomonas coronafaciens pv. garcae]|uniref:NACHT C-terminal Helical domain-containing protein n=3 Tax=Pseudomonas syringae group TaxID=136849 RepID=A0AB37QHW0_9PSED|nr:hypothetical protein [Pseudomonas coronafaciens]RMR94313.1 hypothetical protein ALP74_01763 [Pseudomonas coronafaciens pv. garcae]RMS03170.1 hypothetical protein ALP73_02936 [Pseudomonas coronafaciens pv. garcae]
MNIEDLMALLPIDVPNLTKGSRMEQYKIDKIKGLKHEVSDFHPVLQTLFGKMPELSRVEYNQGPHEKGADFVLEKNDPILDERIYIGVIVKVGKILQNHSEIERQVDECDQDRYFNGGKTKISINEIWIVNNDTISAGAQDKINHKFRAKSIRFVDYEKACRLIDKYYSEYWTDSNRDLSEYIRTTHNQIKASLRSTALIESADIYIEQRLAKITNNYTPRQQNKKIEHFSIQQILEHENLLLIEGHMGTGKSSLINRLIEEHSSAASLQETSTIPILINFSEFNKDYDCSLDRYLEAFCKKTKTSLKDYGFLVAIDAIDEVDMDSESRVKKLISVSQQAREYEKLKLVCVTRGVDNPEESTSLGKHFSRYRILPFTLAQVLNLIGKVCKSVEIKARIQNDLRNSPLFKVLPRTPISAILLAKLLNEDEKEIPSTMTELYSKYMELVLGRWDINKGLQSQKEYEIIENATTEIAKYFILNNLSQISLDEAKSFFENYTKERNLKIDNDSIFKKFISKKEVVLTSERTKTFRFKHRTFAEFFYAKAMIRDSSAVIDEKIYYPYWSTSYFFFIGLKRDCPELIDAINVAKITDEMSRLLKVVNNGNFLLAAYLTPYKHISQGVESSYSEAAQYLVDTFEGTIRSTLSGLTKMHALYIITRCLNEGFRYDYFKEAITASALELAYVKNPSEKDFVKLFLLRNSCLALGEETAFDELLEAHSEELPIYLRLAIKHESEGQDRESVLTNKFNKKLTKQLKSSGSTRQLLSKLYYIPIAEQLKSKPVVKGTYQQIGAPSK